MLRIRVFICVVMLSSLGRFVQAKASQVRYDSKFVFMVGVTDQQSPVSLMKWSSPQWEAGFNTFTNPYLIERTYMTNIVPGFLLDYDVTSWMSLETAYANQPVTKQIFYGYDQSWVNGISYGGARYDFGQVMLSNSPELGVKLHLISKHGWQVSVGGSIEYVWLDGEHGATTDGEKYPTVVLGGQIKPAVTADIRFPIIGIMIGHIGYTYRPIQLETALTPAGNMETQISSHNFWFSIGFPLVLY